ncbi:hypothetical protein [Microbacterium deminutum]|uniref:Uncharacterized protein n=1 Tax=Microbacterium deminutum TaxID=344164 RepID=A0ABP5CZX4_9MICO
MPENRSELDPARVLCLIESIAKETCRTSRAVRRHGAQVDRIAAAIEQLVELQRSANPAAALELDRLAQLRAKLEDCCGSADSGADESEECNCLCHEGAGDGFSHDGSEDGWSVKSRATVSLVDVPERHRPWKPVDRPHHEDDESLVPIGYGSHFGRLEPTHQTPAPVNFRSGQGPVPGSQGPVVFGKFTEDLIAGTWPPDCSGAKAGDVVLASGNLWLKLSVDGGVSFTTLDWTALFDEDEVYGGWAGDQVIIYVPSIDCFVLYVQSYKTKTSPRTNENVVKIALASPSDLKTYKGGKPAWWRQWDFTPDTFGLAGAWMDFPDLSYGSKHLHVNTNVFAGKQGKLFFELPLADMAAGRGLSFLYAFIDTSTRPIIGSPTQNIAGDLNHWAQHIDNSTMRIYRSDANEDRYSWRDRKIANWPLISGGNIVEAAKDWTDWISEDHRIIGAARQGNILWFAWAAGQGTGRTDGKGFSFTRAHIQIAKFDTSQNFKLVEQTQVWNADYAFAYPSLTTNSDDEVGISLAWGGPTSYGSHAVGILGDFVVWFGDASDLTSLRQQQDDTGKPLTNPDGTPLMYSRFGDYVHVRLAHPNARWFSGFGYAANKDASGSETLDSIYVEFGRELPFRPDLH